MNTRNMEWLLGLDAQPKPTPTLLSAVLAECEQEYITLSEKMAHGTALPLGDTEQYAKDICYRFRVRLRDEPHLSAMVFGGGGGTIPRIYRLLGYVRCWRERLRRRMTVLALLSLARRGRSPCVSRCIQREVGVLIGHMILWADDPADPPPHNNPFDDSLWPE